MVIKIFLKDMFGLNRRSYCQAATLGFLIFSLNFATPGFVKAESKTATVSELNQTVVPTSRFGDITLTMPANPPGKVAGFVLYFSAAPSKENSLRSAVASSLGLTVGGLAKHGFIVASIDAELYLKRLAGDSADCFALTGEIERLSQMLQLQAKLPSMIKPTLLADGPAAGIVYAILSESGENFSGGYSRDFCPILALPKNLCPVGAERSASSSVLENIRLLQPQRNTNFNWRFSRRKSGCAMEGAQFFRNLKKLQLKSASLACSSKACPLAQEIAEAQKRFTIEDSVASTPMAPESLPIIELSAAEPKQSYFAIFFSGDGGWATIDKSLGEYLAQSGIGVVGFDSLRYFWSRKDPAKFAEDTEKTIEHYKKAWEVPNYVLIGYSFGADVLPFSLSRLSAEAKKGLLGLVLLNPSHKTDFEVQITDWLHSAADPGGEDVLTEIRKLPHPNLLCIYGMDEEDSLCPLLSKKEGSVHEFPGSHHFGGDYKGLSKLITKFLHRSSRRSAAGVKELQRKDRRAPRG